MAKDSLEPDSVYEQWLSVVEYYGLGTDCHAQSDGDCFWVDCPQEANNRQNYQSHCPLDNPSDEV